MNADLRSSSSETEQAAGKAWPAEPWISMVAGGLPMRQTRRAALRTLALPLGTPATLEGIERAEAVLEERAGSLGVAVTGSTHLVLLTHPVQTPPAEWRWELAVPIRGAVSADALEDAHISQIPGGTHVEVRVPGGLAALEPFYTFFCQEFLPRFKHKLPRPLIAHRLLGERDARKPSSVDLLAAVPVVLSIDPHP